MDNDNRFDGLAQQMRSDNEFYCLMLGSLAQEIKIGYNKCADGLQALATEMRVHAGNMDERIRQVEGRQRLQEQRFSAMLTAVPTMQQFQALEQRVKTLEDRDG